MADEIEEEEPQVKKEEEEEEDSDEEKGANDSVQKEDEEDKNESDDEKKDNDEEGKNEEGKEGKGGEGKEDDKGLTKEEKNRKKAEEKKKKQEEEQKKKEDDKKKKEEDAQKKKEDAKKKKEEKAAEAEKKKTEQNSKPPTPKATLKSIFMVIAGVLLVYSLAALGIASYAMDSALKFRSALSKDMDIYCKEQSQAPDCLNVPEIALAPMYVMLGWSLLLCVAALLALHGLLLERTGSLTTFAATNLVLILVQIAITTLTLIMADEIKSNPKVECLEEGEQGCDNTLLSPLKQTLANLWAYEAVQDFLGCEEAQVPQDLVDCFVSLFDNAATAVACVLMIPLILQAPGIYFALAVRSRVIQEQGMDLFAMCRITYGLQACAMSTVLFIILFGLVIAAIVPAT